MPFICLIYKQEEVNPAYSSNTENVTHMQNITNECYIYKQDMMDLPLLI